VAAEDLLVHYGRHGEAVEAVGEGFPQLYVVAPFTFIVKSVNSVDGRTFMVTSQQEKVLGIFDLQKQLITMVR